MSKGNVMLNFHNYILHPLSFFFKAKFFFAHSYFLIKDNVKVVKKGK